MAKGKKTGGRKAGTPNRATRFGKDFIADVLSNYKNSGKFQEDFDNLEDPKDRLLIAEKFLNYIMPKQQSTSVDINADSSHTLTIEDRLRSLSDK